VIGGAIMNELHSVDQVAYVRFASVYRSFKDIDEFMHELEDLIRLRKESAAPAAPPAPTRDRKGEHAARKGEPAS
jgi:transcriptional repressor NrdR